MAERSTESSTEEQKGVSNTKETAERVSVGGELGKFEYPSRRP